MAIPNDGKNIYLYCDDNSFQIYDTESEQLLRHFKDFHQSKIVTLVNLLNSIQRR